MCSNNWKVLLYNWSRVEESHYCYVAVRKVVWEPGKLGQEPAYRFHLSQKRCPTSSKSQLSYQQKKDNNTVPSVAADVSSEQTYRAYPEPITLQGEGRTSQSPPQSTTGSTVQTVWVKISGSQSKTKRLEWEKGTRREETGASRPIAQASQVWNPGFS